MFRFKGFLCSRRVKAIQPACSLINAVERRSYPVSENTLADRPQKGKQCWGCARTCLWSETLSSDGQKGGERILIPAGSFGKLLCHDPVRPIMILPSSPSPMMGSRKEGGRQRSCRGWDTHEAVPAAVFVAAHVRGSSVKYGQAWGCFESWY